MPHDGETEELVEEGQEADDLVEGCEEHFQDIDDATYQQKTM